MPDSVSDVEPRASLDQQVDDVVVARERGLMEWRRVTVIPVRIVPVRIFAGLEQPANDFGVSQLRRKSQCPNPITAYTAASRPIVGQVTQSKLPTRMSLIASPPRGVRSALMGWSPTCVSVASAMASMVIGSAPS